MHTLNFLCAYVDWEAPLHYFGAWIMKFHRNCEVLTNSLIGPTPILHVEERARVYKRLQKVLLMNKIPIQAKILGDI